MTANPSWKEIQDELLTGADGVKQTASDCPDIVAHVFELN
jgi:hypothetical protein